MTSVQILSMLAKLLGGLTFFLFGMSVMSTGLENTAGGKLEQTLKKVTSRPLISFSLGAGITIAIQSSSAMTVMLVGLVNSGIISFPDTFGMIMGSHVGTTLTSWILTLSGISADDNLLLALLKPMIFGMILAFIGVAMRMISRNDKKKNIGTIFIGFAILMTGMDFMSASMDSVKDMPGFVSLLTAFSSPIIAFLVSTVFTGIIQSSAATVAIVQTLALTGCISYKVAIPLVIGANVGTCMTALISCFGTSKDAKRVVALHFYTNAIGGIIFVILLYGANLFWAKELALSCSMIGVAVIHTFFNILNTVAFLPFKNAVLKLCRITVKKKDEHLHTVFLDERLFNNTALAISECSRLTGEMANLSRQALLNSISLIDHFDPSVKDTVREQEALIDKYEDKLGTYLVRLSNNELSERDSHKIARMLHGIGDFERIGDHALNICDVAGEMHDKSVRFSDEALTEIGVITAAVKNILNMAMDSFLRDDAAAAAHVEPLEQVIDELRATLKNRHITRLQNGECTIELGFIFTDLLTNYERVSDHCSNIAVYTLQLSSDMLDTHKYLGQIKGADSGEYVDDFKKFEQMYTV